MGTRQTRRLRAGRTGSIRCGSASPAAATSIVVSTISSVGRGSTLAALNAATARGRSLSRTCTKASQKKQEDRDETSAVLHRCEPCTQQLVGRRGHVGGEGHSHAKNQGRCD